MEDVRANLARNLIAARLKAGISQEDLAGLAEVDRTYVSGIERGKRNPTILVVSKFAKVLGLTTAELLSAVTPTRKR
jgi:transcriptional regulator with XRE-family HTH domain